MHELISINYESETPTVLGRDLHEMLEIDSNYTTWFNRMCEYGFTEEKDFIPFLEESTGGRPSTDHQLTLNMAKEICMIQRSEKGKQCREYFISIEEQWNSPASVMSRALRFADIQIAKLTSANTQLIADNEIMKPKATYYDLVLQCKDLIAITVIAKDYGKSAKWLNKKLSDLNVQYLQSGIWVLYQKYADKGYTQSKTFPTPDTNGEIHSHPHTYWTQKGRMFIYELLKKDGILPVVETEKAIA